MLSCPEEGIKCKVNLSLCLIKHHANIDILGSGGIAPLVLNLDTKWMWVVSFTARQIHPRGKNPWNPLDGRLGGTQNRPRRGGEEKEYLALPGIEVRSSSL
jgi:hypothetical protein